MIADRVSNTSQFTHLLSKTVPLRRFEYDSQKKSRKISEILLTLMVWHHFLLDRQRNEQKNKNDLLPFVRILLVSYVVLKQSYDFMPDLFSPFATGGSAMMFGVPDKVRRAASAVSDWHGEIGSAQ